MTETGNPKLQLLPPLMSSWNLGFEEACPRVAVAAMCLVLHPPRLHPRCQLPSACQAQSPQAACHVLLTGSQRTRNHKGPSASDGISSSSVHCTLKTAARLSEFGGCLHHPSFPVRSLRPQEGQMTRNSQAVTGPGSLNLRPQNELHFQFLVLLQGSCGDQILVAQRERLAPIGPS